MPACKQKQEAAQAALGPGSSPEWKGPEEKNQEQARAGPKGSGTTLGNLGCVLRGQQLEQISSLLLASHESECNS